MKKCLLPGGLIAGYTALDAASLYKQACVPQKLR